MDRSELAVQLFRDGLNCSQAILTVYGESYGMDQALAKKLGRPLGGGLGRAGKICGAVTGSIVALGLAQGNPEDEAGARNTLALSVRECMRRFEERHGTTLCCDLLQADMGTEAGARKIREEQLVARLCPAFVKDAAEILSELLSSETRSDVPSR